MKRKRVVIIADLQSGHEYGLVPPSMFRPVSQKAGRFQRELWKFYSSTIRSLKPIYALLVVGDAVEGKGPRSGGTELLTTDRHRQALMATEAIDLADAKKVRLFHGTRYHVGTEEDFEDTIVQSAKCKDISIGDRSWFRCGRQILDVRHFVGNSSVPYGRHTAVAKERVWNLIWADHLRQPKATITIRAHVHYFGYEGDDGWLGITCPALSYNSSFGKRECSGVVNVGLLVFDFESDGSFSWQPILAEFPALRVRAESL